MKLIAQPAIHFSLYENASYLVNPSKVGLIDEMQMNVSSRKQWLSVDAGSLLAVASFLKPLYNRGLEKKKQYGGLSFTVLQERSGSNGLLETSQAFSNFSYNLNLSSKHILALGLQAGYYHQRINLNKITTDNQYVDFVHDPSIDHGELLSTDGKGTVLFATGFSWVYGNSTADKMAWLSSSVQNLGGSDLSLLSIGENKPLILSADAGVRVFTHGKFNLYPTVRFLLVDNMNQINIGVLTTYKVNSVKTQVNKIGIGIWSTTEGTLIGSLECDADRFTIAAGYGMPIFSSVNIYSVTNFFELHGAYKIKSSKK
jgi:type IX secretion system PorP/SprF family membrane protein